MRVSPARASVALCAFLIALCAGAFAYAAPVAERHTLTAAEEAIVSRFISHYRDVRPTTAADCVCDAAIAAVRKGAHGRRVIADYDPYVLIADFNGDGVPDMAVLLFDRSWDTYAPGVLLIFNGPLKAGMPPSFVHGGMILQQRGLFLSSTHRLVFGRFGGGGCAYVPYSQGYREDCAPAPNAG